MSSTISSASTSHSSTRMLKTSSQLRLDLECLFLPDLQDWSVGLMFPVSEIRFFYLSLSHNWELHNLFSPLNKFSTTSSFYCNEYKQNTKSFFTNAALWVSPLVPFSVFNFFFFGFCVFLVHPTVLSVLLSASVERVGRILAKHGGVF